jgi:hypothetical protein
VHTIFSRFQKVDYATNKFIVNCICVKIYHSETAGINYFNI